MASQGRGTGLRGRDSECAELTNLLSTVESGKCGVLVLRGEAGVGKTALLDYAAGNAPAFRRLHVAGVESDMDLAFAAVHQLCAPLLEHADDLPQPQRDALNVAFGRGVGPTPGRFLVGLAVLSLLSAAAGRHPLLCIIDDAQWLDGVSGQTLAFVARRLLAEPVALLFAARDRGAEALSGLPELALGGLSDRPARQLLNDAVPGRIDKRVEDRIVAETRGIPLALLEVPRNFPPEELSGGFANLRVRPAADQVEEGFAQRIASLPSDTRRLLLIAAAEPMGDAALFLRAAARFGIAVDALGPAEAAGLIDFGPRMRFHHPLVRSAAYHAADIEDRRMAHRVLADVTDPRADPDRRAWHAASAASAPDDAVAAELEASADRARSRGGIASAATFFERATALTSDPSLRVARALAAARAKRDAAAPPAADEILGIAEIGPLTDLQRAQVMHLRAQMEFAGSRGGETGAPPLSEAASQLVDAAKELETVDDDLAREAYLEALTAAMYAGRLGDADGLVKIAEAAKTTVEYLPAAHRPIDLLLRGVVQRILGGPGSGSDVLRAALDLMCAQAKRDDGEVLHWMSLGLAIVPESAAGEVWDDTVWQPLATDLVRHARDAGALALLPSALVFRAGVHLHAGEFATAAALIDEANSIAVATGYAPLRYHSLSLIAWRGDAAAATALIDEMAADGLSRGEGRVLCLTGYVAAVLYNGLGRYDEAFAAARRGAEYEDFGLHWWCLMELVEAATRTGERETAAHAVRRLEASAGVSATDWGLGSLARAQAMLADDDAADALFTEAVERLGRTSIAVHHARSRLLYGEWLRRVNRRGDARRHLAEAHRMFTQMGARAFAERARRELVATGDKVRSQPIHQGDQLTAQEAQIAQLASEGLTNHEIGAQLFISSHTVEWHLRKVFAKLGITSRRQLRTMSRTGRS